MEHLITSKGVFLKRESEIVFFQPESMDLFTIETGLKDTSLPEIVKRFNQSNDVVIPQVTSERDEVAYLSQRQAILPFIVGENVLKSATSRPVLSRLTLNISNDCNLRCAYCYADHGHYHAAKSQMPGQRAEAIAKRILAIYSNVKVVHFFGGEPLMNPKAINAVGFAFERAALAGDIPHLPKFVATTNGTISSDQVIETLKVWSIEPTISWDGPQEIQDSQRPLTGRGSSYRRVVKTLERFQNNSIPYSIECTFNASHIRSGISIVDLMDFFFANTNQRLFHIAPTFTPLPRMGRDNLSQDVFRISSDEEQSLLIDIDSIIPLYRDAARYTVRNFLTGTGPLLEFAFRVVEQILLKKKSLTYCPAFFNQLSIAIDGALFPCFMFAGDTQFCLGNILTDEIPTISGLKVFKRYFEDFGPNTVGTEEWYRPLFGGCVAGDYIATSKLNIRYLAPLYKAIIEECIFELAVGAKIGFLHQTEEGVH